MSKRLAHPMNIRPICPVALQRAEMEQRRLGWGPRVDHVISTCMWHPASAELGSMAPCRHERNAQMVVLWLVIEKTSGWPEGLVF